MQTKTYVLFPQGSSVENTQRFWAAKARLAHEGKTLELNMCNTVCRFEVGTSTEIIVLAYEHWDKDLTIQNAIHQANLASHPLRLLNPHSWKELPLAQKVVSRRKPQTKTKQKSKITSPNFA